MYILNALDIYTLLLDSRPNGKPTGQSIIKFDHFIYKNKKRKQKQK